MFEQNETVSISLKFEEEIEQCDTNYWTKLQTNGVKEDLR